MHLCTKRASISQTMDLNCFDSKILKTKNNVVYLTSHMERTFPHHGDTFPHNIAHGLTLNLKFTGQSSKAIKAHIITMKCSLIRSKIYEQDQSIQLYKRCVCFYKIRNIYFMGHQKIDTKHQAQSLPFVFLCSTHRTLIFNAHQCY